MEKKKLEIGDTICCADGEDAVNTMIELQKAGVETDFLYILYGKEGIWLEVTGIEE